MNETWEGALYIDFFFFFEREIRNGDTALPCVLSFWEEEEKGGHVVLSPKRVGELKCTEHKAIPYVQ